MLNSPFLPYNSRTISNFYRFWILADLHMFNFLVFKSYNLAVPWLLIRNVTSKLEIIFNFQAVCCFFFFFLNRTKIRTYVILIECDFLHISRTKIRKHVIFYKPYNDTRIYHSSRMFKLPFFVDTWLVAFQSLARLFTFFQKIVVSLILFRKSMISVFIRDIEIVFVFTRWSINRFQKLNSLLLLLNVSYDSQLMITSQSLFMSRPRSTKQNPLPWDNQGTEWCRRWLSFLSNAYQQGINYDRLSTRIQTGQPF
jgi:hypothetical protein